MRITGSNFGVCPTVSIGYAQVLFCPDLARNLPVTPGATFDLADGLTFPVPRGEGVGLSVVVIVGDQNTASQVFTLSYDYPVASAIIAASRAAGIPTTGGTRIYIAGSGFGYHIPGSPTSWGWSSDAIAASTTSSWVRSPSDPMPPIVEIGGAGSGAVGGWTQCVNVIRYNDSLLSCQVPEGDGAALDVRVTVANAPANVSGSGVFSYDAPSVSSITCAGLGCGSAGADTSAFWTPSSSGSSFGQAVILAQVCTHVPYMTT